MHLTMTTSSMTKAPAQVRSSNLGKGKGRHENSLSVLTKKFVDLIKNSENGTIDLN